MLISGRKGSIVTIINLIVRDEVVLFLQYIL